MQYKFTWATAVPNEYKTLAEAAVWETTASVHSPITFCHDGIVLVRVSVAGMFNGEFVGNLKCSCGRKERHARQEYHNKAKRSGGVSRQIGPDSCFPIIIRGWNGHDLLR